MQEPTRFGDFLLLKRLSEDPLGQIYRAGRIEGTSLAEHVFLRTFSVAGAIPAELAASVRETAAGRRIEGPGLTYSLENGEVGGVAYVAYEPFIGWDLDRVVKEANAGFSTLETDHALLIVERIAKGLAVVHQTDPALARPYHGFLVPQNVLVTGEGEIKLMGFEAAPYLGSLAAAGTLGELHSYLSPQVRHGEAPTAGDDVYSLGAILWRLLLDLTPPPDGAELTASLAMATTTDGKVLPAGLAELLQSSFAAPRSRTAHAGLWHKELTEWMARNEITTTHFDLAFFIHELFRKKILSEQQEIEQEMRLDLSPAAAEPEGAEASDVILRPDLSGMMPRPDLTGPGTDLAPDTAVRPPPPRRSKMPLFLGLVALAVAALAVGGWLLFGGGAPAEPPPPVRAVPPPLPPPVVPPPSEELQTAQLELERLVQESAQAVGEQIASEYEEQIRSLREQLREAQAAEAEALRQAAETASPPPSSVSTDEGSAEAGPLATEPPAAPEPAAPEPATPEPATPEPATPEPATPEPAAPEPAAPEPDSSEPESPVPARSDSGVSPEPAAPEPATPEPAAPGPAGSDAAASEPAASEPAVPESTAQDSPTTSSPPSSPGETAPPPEAAPPPPEAAPPPAPPPAAVVTPPRRLRMPDPVYPARARQHRKEATVLIKVLVDVHGKVIEAAPVLDEPDTYGFYQAAIRAARAAVFEPATTNGVPTEMWTTVVMTFKP